MKKFFNKLYRSLNNIINELIRYKEFMYIMAILAIMIDWEACDVSTMKWYDLLMHVISLIIICICFFTIGVIEGSELEDDDKS